MKQVKIAFEKCQKKIPNRPPDEIDFGLGFRAGLEWIKELPLQKDGPNRAEDLIVCIEKELGIKSYD